MAARKRCSVPMLLLVLLGAGHLHVSAQVLPFDSYTVKDGLLSNDIFCITQDAEGYLWVGTRDGISIFDGHQFNNLTAADGLPSNLITEIAEDCTSDAKTMWFLGANGSLARWYRGRCVPFNYDSTLSWARHITTLCMDRSGILWAGTEDTLIQVVQLFQHMEKSATETENLTDREIEMLSLVAKGYYDKELAEQLFLSIKTIRTHLRNIYKKLHVRSRTEAVLKYLQRM
jgi:DNA-binding CsgD family transcriptional regulator